MDIAELNIVEEKIDIPLDIVVSFPSLRWDWHDEDATVIDAIHTKVDARIREEFRVGYNALANLFMQARIPDEDEFGNAKVFNGEIIWRKNPDGSVMENWANVESKYLDAFVLNASLFNVYAGGEAIDAKMEAVFAKYAHDDAYSEHYHKLAKGTIKDKESIATLATAEDRYFAMYKAYYFKKKEDFITRLDNMVRRVERVREMQNRDSDREMRKILR